MGGKFFAWKTLPTQVRMAFGVGIAGRWLAGEGNIITVYLKHISIAMATHVLIINSQISWKTSALHAAYQRNQKNDDPPKMIIWNVLSSRPCLPRQEKKENDKAD